MHSDKYSDIKKGFNMIDKSIYEDLLESYNESIRLNPNDSSAYMKKGSLLLSINRQEEGLAAYEQALRIDLAKRYF